MLFENFDSFDFMYEQLATPITVIIQHSDSKRRDEHGKVVKGEAETIHLNEPVVNTTNPNVTYNNEPGGQQQQATMYWESKKISNAPKGTIVKTDFGDFKTTELAQVVTADIYYYPLKRVGDDND